MNYTLITCTHCGKQSYKYVGHVNRAKKKGLNVYCDRKCAGLHRRTTIEEKKKVKAAYDKIYRQKNLERKKKQAYDYFKRTYDPVKAAIERKKRMPKHIEYCRQPKYKAYKKQYDRKYRAKKNYGELAEAAIVLMDLKLEIDNRLAKSMNGLTTKSLKRKRSCQKQS